MKLANAVKTGSKYRDNKTQIKQSKVQKVVKCRIMCICRVGSIQDTQKGVDMNILRCIQYEQY